MFEDFRVPFLAGLGKEKQKQVENLEANPKP